MYEVPGPDERLSRDVEDRSAMESRSGMAGDISVRAQDHSGTPGKCTLLDGTRSPLYSGDRRTRGYETKVQHEGANQNRQDNL